MHYKNGREAKNGDMVLLNPSWGAPIIGILYNAQAGNDNCNGKIAPVSPSDSCPDLKDCLHIDDVKAAISEVEKQKSAVHGAESRTGAEQAAGGNG